METPTRTSFRTEFRDLDVLAAALDLAGATCEIAMPVVDVRSPVQLKIDLSTGVATAADGPAATDLVRRLQQFYAEAKYKKELTRQGGYVEGRTVDKDGNIVLMCAIRSTV